MAYSRDLLKMARQQCGIALWIEIAVILNWRYGMVWIGFVGIIWCQMTSEFIHEEISIMDYNGLS